MNRNILRKNKLKTLLVLFIISLIFLTSCEKAVEPEYSISVNIHSPVEANQIVQKNSFSDYPISKAVLEIFKNGTKIASYESNQLLFNDIRLAPGIYQFIVNSYFNQQNQEKLFFYGSKTVDINSNTTIAIDTKLASGTVSLSLSSNDSSFEISQATVTFINKAYPSKTLLICNPKISYQNSQAVASFEIYPGVWEVESEVYVRRVNNQTDVRYSKSANKKYIYVEPSKLTNYTEKLSVPSENEIGTIVQVQTSDIHDGDTFKDTSGNTYRIIGIDAPEVSAGTKPIGEFNQEALYTLVNFVNSSNGYVRVSVRGTDAYGRKLAYVFSQTAKRFFEEEILRNGYARPLFYDESDDPILTPRLINAYSYAYEHRNGIYSKWDTAPVIEISTSGKDNYIGKIVWLKGTVTNVSFDSSADKWILILDDGWGKIEIRREEYQRLIKSSLSNLNNKTVKFYGELWKESGIYKILLRAEWEYIILN
ncbi:MAG: thermonuclease family protein [Fervidobacterium sp.]